MLKVCSTKIVPKTNNKKHDITVILMRGKPSISCSISVKKSFKRNFSSKTKFIIH